MPGVSISEFSADSPITSIATGISAALAYTDRGVPNDPVLVVGGGQLVDKLGYFRSDSFSNYMLRGSYNNGARSFWIPRQVGPLARVAAGAEYNKIAQSKPQLSHGAGDAELHVLSDVRGVNGALTNLVIETDAVDNITTASLANTYDISMLLAKTDVWKKTSNVCATVLNGQAHLVLGGAAATNCFCAYAATAGADGNSLEIEIVDSGGAGPATYAYNAAGTKLTIDLVGVAVTSAAAVVGVNALAGTILSYEVGDGLGNIAVAIADLLEGGRADIPALLTASHGGTGLGTKLVMSRTFLAGKGVVVKDAYTFTDTNTLDAFTAVASKVVPGDKFIVYNGANAGAYNIVSTDSEKVITIDEKWRANQTNIIYSVYGSNNKYGHAAIYTTSPGTRCDNLTVKITKESGGTTLKAVAKVLDGDSAIRTLETLTGMAPGTDAANFIDTIVASKAYWFRTQIAVEKIMCTGTGTSVAGDATFTNAAATFEDDEVEDGDLLIVTSATTAADVKVFEITDVTNQTTLEVDANFAGTQADCVYTVVGDDHNGAELLNLVGSSGITLSMAGGVNDLPTKTTYLGSESLKTGVYSINKIPVLQRPNKFFVPDVANVVDGSGVDATDSVVKAMYAYAENKDWLAYFWSAEYGLDPTNLLLAVNADGIDTTHGGEYWPWIKVDDPITDDYKWIPPTGHMLGVMDGMDSGQLGEGMHQAPANIPLKDVVDLEYKVDPDGGEGSELNLINDAGVNVIIKKNGIRPYGDRLRTTDKEKHWLHKRLVSIRTVYSIKNTMDTWVFMVNALSAQARARKSIDGYMYKFDRRSVPTGAFENPKDASTQPWYLRCDSTNNDLGEPVLNVELGFCVVNTIEDIKFRWGLWDGGSSPVEEV